MGGKFIGASVTVVLLFIQKGWCYVAGTYS